MPTISIQLLEKRKSSVPDWSIPLPPELSGDNGEPLTLRKLIERIVCDEVDAFRIRQEGRRFHRFLTRQEIEESLRKGKVDSGGRDLKQEVNEDEAVGAAWQAFEDGLYLVFIDDVEKTRLDEQVHLRQDSTIKFIRLTMLAGG